MSVLKKVNFLIAILTAICFSEIAIAQAPQIAADSK